MNGRQSSDRIRSSVRLTLGGTFASAVVQFATMATLSRLLTPADYGFYIVALSINAVSTAFIASSLERVLIIEDDAQAMNGRSVPILCVLTMVALLAFAMTNALVSGTGWAVDLRVLGMVLVAQLIAAFALVPRAKFRRVYRYAPIIGGEVAGLILGNLTLAYLLAREGFGPISLALGMIAGNTVSSLAILLFDRTGFESVKFRDSSHIRKTAIGLIKLTSVEAANVQVTPLVLSGLLGPISLGLFNRVYTLTALPIQLMVASVNRVLLTFFVDVSKDVEKSRATLRRTVRMIGFLTIPVAFGVGGASREFVEIALGEQWLDGANIVPYLTAAMSALMIASVLGQLADATKRFNEKRKVQTIATSILIVSTILGSVGELVGVSIAFLISSMIFLALSIRLASKIIGVAGMTVLGWLFPSLIVGGGCFAVSAALSWSMPSQPAYLVFAMQIGGSGMIALLGALTVARDVLGDIVSTAFPAQLAARVLRLLRT